MHDLDSRSGYRALHAYTTRSLQKRLRRARGLDRERKPAYYEDGSEALRFRKSLWNKRRAKGDIALRVHYYGQTLGLTCGPARC